MLVIKRDGREVPFEPLKIKNAIMNSFNEMYDEITDDMTACAEKITSDISALNKTLSVEEIQDMVEKKLMASKYKGVAKCYINYRYLHKMVRDKYSDFMEAVSHKLNADDVQNQNANVDEYSFGGRIGEAADIMTKRFALDYIVSPMARKNHEENMIYIHDLNAYAVGSHNCLSIPFDELLAKGFNTRQTDVRPAQSINTAFQLVAVIFQLQSLQQFGGVSATHLDWTMVPYVRKSFFKHYIIAYLKDNEEFNNIDLMEMLFDTYTDNIGVVRNRFDDWIDAHKTEFFNKTNLSIEDFYFNNDKLDFKYRQSALYDTIIECQQAVEGMYHNLK